MRVLLDTNVLLDSMLQRPPWHADADAILQAAGHGEVTCAATVLSLANLFYVGRRVVGTDQARIGVQSCLNSFEIVAIDRQVLLDADALPGSDFEDNVQIAAAVASGLDAIVTRDPSGFAHSPLPVWSPAELLQHLSQPGGSGTP
jgi:predicted nucleic acid-binding protein